MRLALLYHLIFMKKLINKKAAFGRKSVPRPREHDANLQTIILEGDTEDIQDEDD